VILCVIAFGEDLKQRSRLLLRRIRGLSDAKMETYTINGTYYGAPRRVRTLIGAAIKAYEADDFGSCERACETAEAVMLAERAKQASP
jgi:hypothetical protein